MQLVIKLNKDKTSRLGIKYPQEYLAVKAYESLITTYGQTAFNLKIELRGKQLDLTLVPAMGGKSLVYKSLDYDLSQIQKLQAFGASVIPLEFVHIYSKSNALVIAKPFKTQRFISICAFEMIGSHVFDGFG